MSEWIYCTWGDLVTLEYGKSLNGYRESNGRVPVYGTNGLIGWNDKPLCDFPSVIIGRKGAYRGVHYSSEPFFVIDTAFYLKPRPDIEIDTKWAYYCLLNQDINSMDSGSAIPSTSRDDFYSLEVTLPPLPEQRAIAEMLGSLDDKIEANRRQNETLEATARAIFKSWFVDFDPVHANARGETPHGMDAATAALFPAEFEESELGLIPRGWGVVSFDKAIDFKEGPGIRYWQYTNNEEGIRFLNIRCIQDGDLMLNTANRVTEKEALGKYSHFLLAQDDLVVSTSGTLGRTAIVREQHLPLMLNTSIIRMRPIQGITTKEYVWSYMRGVHKEKLDIAEESGISLEQNNEIPFERKWNQNSTTTSPYYTTVSRRSPNPAHQPKSDALMNMSNQQ